MIILGAFLKKKPVIKFDTAIEGLKKVLPERYHKLIPLNKTAMEKGMELAEKVRVTV
jgi:2-oxoglutarate ferredoxin oxidoreductase subunit gamma